MMLGSHWSEDYAGVDGVCALVIR